MPYDRDEEEKDGTADDGGADQQQLTGAVSDDGGSGRSGAGSRVPQGAAGKPPATGGATNDPSRFVNFDRYLAANAGTAKAAGDRLAGGVETAGGAAQGAIDSASSQFGKDVTAGTNTYGGQTVGDVYDPSSAARGVGNTRVKGQGLESTSTKGDVSTGPDRQSIDEVRNHAQQAYTGPQSLMDAQYNYGDLDTNSHEAAEQARNLTSQSGREALLQQHAGSTPGGTRFSAALEGAANGDRFSQLAQRYGGLEKYLTDALGNSYTAAQGAQSASNTAAGQWQDLANEWASQAPAKPGTAAPVSAAGTPLVPLPQVQKGTYVPTEIPDYLVKQRMTPDAYAAWVRAGKPPDLAAAAMSASDPNWRQKVKDQGDPNANNIWK